MFTVYYKENQNKVLHYGFRAENLSKAITISTMKAPRNHSIVIVNNLNQKVYEGAKL